MHRFRICFKEKADTGRYHRLSDVMNAELPWMSDCVTKIDVTNIGAQHDLKDIAVASEEDILPPEEI